MTLKRETDTLDQEIIKSRTSYWHIIDNTLTVNIIDALIGQKAEAVKKDLEIKPQWFIYLTEREEIIWRGKEMEAEMSVIKTNTSESH